MRERRLTPSQVAARERRAAIDQRNRRLMVGTIGFGLLAVASSGFLLLRNTGSVDTPPTPTFDPPSPQDDLFITRYAVQEFGLTNSSAEKALWEGKPFEVLSVSQKPLLPEIQQAEQRYIDRISTVSDLMRKSTIPELRDAITYLDALGQVEQVYEDHKLDLDGRTFQILPFLNTSTGRERIAYYLQGSMRKVLSHTSPLFIASAIAHEVEHLHGEFAYINQRGTTPARDVLSQIRARSEDRQYLIDDEARGYAINARVYIRARGMGIQVTGQGERKQLEELTKNYILTGASADSEGWKKYIENDYLK